MIVDVEMSGWEQACCGEPFSVGGEVTWPVLARDLPDAPRRRFLETHHGGLDLPGEQAELTGVVREILEVRHAVVSIAGTRVLTRDEAESSEVEVEAVTRDAEVDGYRIALEVDDDAELPTPFPDDTAERVARDAEERARVVDAWTRTPDGLATRALIESLRAAYGGAVRIVEAQGGAGVTIEPANADAADLLWQVRADMVTVHTGRGSFALETVDELAGFADAVAKGRVREVARDGGAATVVGAVEGEEWVDAVQSPGDGVWLKSTHDARRLRAEPRAYAPW